MNIAVVAQQSSRWEDLHRAATVLVKSFRRLGHKAWLVTSIYHEGRPVVDPRIVEKSENGYVEVEADVAGVPTIRVLSMKSLTPPGGVVLRSFGKILGALQERHSLDLVVVVASFWNGPEEAARWISIRRSLAELGEAPGRPLFVFVPAYFVKFTALRPVDSAAKLMWSMVNMPYIMRRADLVLVCCQAEAEELKQYGVPSGKVVESKSWVDPDFVEVKDVGRPKAAEGFDLYVSYVGSLDEERNIQTLIKAAERLSRIGNVALVAAGGGDALERARKEAKRRDNLVVLENPDLKTVVSVIKHSFVGVDFSRYEPMGIRALDYLYMGVPYAASPASRATWYISNGVDGIQLSHPDDVEGFTSWVSMLMKRPELRDEMAAKAMKKAEGLNALKLAELLLKAAEGRTTPS
ncbi:glycosyltransferase [Pyrobaculum neutrophilum]|uniref:Glycosyl transferase group 1 n=1 Tax=Pyrobaculum neutrophilum (strain DSM 2338 / JCM 9278 / NBRC 100436 / V24Sta) TaxID=444157 RepID=B1YB95_PYRNV|nr:glycosyltransferase [Pyrobaculum neutrophilum]ACB39226.1 glycosyl transferase group 1 [Pyrobaculum neutrophilum V24Sta]